MDYDEMRMVAIRDLRQKLAQTERERDTLRAEVERLREERADLQARVESLQVALGLCRSDSSEVGL